MPRIVNVDEMLLWARRNGYPIPNNVLWLLCHYPEVKTQLLEEDTTSDLISRAAAVDDLHGKDPSQIWDTADIEVWVNALPSAQPETHDKRAEMHACDLIDRSPSSSCNHENDTISRQAVIDLLKQMRKDGDMVPWEGKDVFARIRKLPSAQPAIPLPHGRLIDADALISELTIDPVECPGCPEPEYLGEFIDLLEGAPTVIEAEE